MALDKKTLNDFLPNGFETQNKTDYKTNFTSEQISVGYEKDTLQTLSGPNLNNLLDVTGKNFHTLNEIMTYFKNMPIGSFPIVNTSNQLDYKSVNSFFRNVGEIVPSLIPLEDENLRLLDGSLLENNITYSRFISYIAGLRSTLPNLFTTEANWQAQVQQYGECGKFVYNTTDRSLRLPKVVSYLKGTNDSSSLGDLVEAGIPQHTHSGTTESGGGSHDHGRGTMDITGTIKSISAQSSGINLSSSDAFTTYKSGEGGGYGTYKAGAKDAFNFRASNSWTGRTTSESIAHTHAFTTGTASDNTYKSGVTTVNPQSIKIFYYIVVSIDEAEKQVLSAVYNYKGSVATYADLPNDAAIGEVYNVIGEDPEGYSGANFAWTGEEWDRLGGTVNLTGYLTKVEAGNTYATKASLESNVDNLQEQINTNASNIANIASQEVIDAGIQKIEALKFSSTIGHGISTDTDLFAVIQRYAHSSFDSSKFTVTGTPTITSDGIASGFSSSNKISKSLSITGNKFSARCGFFYKVGSSAGTVFGIFSSDTSCGRCYVSTSGTIVITVPATTTETLTVTTSDMTFTENDFIVVTFEYNENSTCKFTITNITTGQTVIRTSTAIWNKNIEDITLVYFGSNGSSEAYAGRVDLKYNEIIIDNTPVFSGNVTGIDIIKDDDFTVVGTPTISADGILTVSDGSNYVSGIAPILWNGKSWRLEFDIDFNASTTVDQRFMKFAGNRYNVFNYKASWNSIYVQLYDTDNVEGGNATINSVRTKFIAGKIHIKLYFDYTTGEYYFTAQQGNGTLYESSHKTLANKNLRNQASDLFYGNLSNYADTPEYGALDLNSIKFYDANGNFVYQPLLRIPYTLSNTDLKITRNMDRAIDMANQCGYSQYFGLDEQNGLCLVPQGDNITGRRDLVHREEDGVTHYVIERYSDLYCKQQGTCTADTPVVFAQPYKDNYPKISVPYSAKSKTGFTPTVSGDWTAEGYTFLV